jgi:all-trans-retinol dehydrogenase (NAD+)
MSHALERIPHFKHILSLHCNVILCKNDMASTVTSTLKGAAHEPILTGTLLYLLTRGPTHLREQILGPFQSNLLAKNGAARLAVFITVLKVLTGLGVVRRINAALNNLAWNNWKLFGRPGAPFSFGSEKNELVIITGGSSGFGYEMVKGFSQHARVVVLDIANFPPELSSSKYGRGRGGDG